MVSTFGFDVNRRFVTKLAWLAIVSEARALKNNYNFQFDSNLLRIVLVVHSLMQVLVNTEEAVEERGVHTIQQRPLSCHT